MLSKLVNISESKDDFLISCNAIADIRMKCVFSITDIIGVSVPHKLNGKIAM